MRRARQLVPVLALAAFPLLAALPAPAVAQADADNPPIETEKTITGDTIRVQRFQRPAFDIDPAQLTIAQRKMLRVVYGAFVSSAQVIAIECPAMSSGRIAPGAVCGSAGEPDFFRTRFANRLIGLTGGALPNIPETAVDRSKRVQRLIRFEVRVPAFPASEPEPAEGPIVESKDVNGLAFTKGPVDYPGGALRKEAQGRMVALCQVQVDRSIACTQESFTPPENAALFAEGASTLFLAGKVDPVLANGAKSEGARFRYAVNFALPK